jgi:hypothetical protein
MPLPLAEFERLAAEAPPGTPLAEILKVANVYWSGSLTDHIYFVPDVIGKTAAIVPSALKDRFGG